MVTSAAWHCVHEADFSCPCSYANAPLACMPQAAWRSTRKRWLGAQALAGVAFREPRIPVYSNVTAAPLPSVAGRHVRAAGPPGAEPHPRKATLE